MAAIDSPALSSLIDRIYAAATAPETWPGILRDVAGALNAKSGLLRTLDLRERPSVLASYHHNLDPALQSEYCAHFVGQDPFLQPLKRLAPGRMVTNDRLVDLHALRRTTFYRHYLQPLDNHYIVGGFVERDNSLYTILGLHRHQGASPFSREEQEGVQLLAPHIRRSVQLQRQLAGEAQRADAAEAALETLGVAAFLLDGRGRVVHANERGEQLAQSGHGLRIGSGGHLTAATAAQAQAFADMVARASRGSGEAPAPVAASILLREGPDRAPTIMATAYPVPQRGPASRESLPRARAAVYAGDLDDTGLLRPEVLTTLYGLTPAESRLAVALARGRELAELGEAWGVSPQTLRTQLKAIFAKTDVRRQSELVRLLAGTPWKLATPARTAEAPG